jgi:hypothetical protein
MHYLVIDDATGALVSEGTVLADPLPAGLVVIAVPEAPDWAAVEWAVTIRALRPRAAAVRRSCSQVEFSKRVGFATMSAANRARIDTATPLQTRADLETLRQLMQDGERIELEDEDTVMGVQVIATIAAQAGIIPNSPEAIAAEAARILAPFPT